MSRRPSARAALEASANVFAALGDETRLRLITRLGADGPQSVGDLTEGTRVTRQAVAKHLRVLEGAGIVRGVRQGRASVWELEREGLDEARRSLDRISEQWDAALAKLREFVER